MFEAHHDSIGRPASCLSDLCPGVKELIHEVSGVDTRARDIDRLEVWVEELIYAVNRSRAAVCSREEHRTNRDERVESRSVPYAVIVEFCVLSHGIGREIDECAAASRRQSHRLCIDIDSGDIDRDNGRIIIVEHKLLADDKFIDTVDNHNASRTVCIRCDNCEVRTSSDLIGNNFFHVLHEIVDFLRKDYSS